jgi:hypothetical protein
MGILPMILALAIQGDIFSDIKVSHPENHGVGHLRALAYLSLRGSVATAAIWKFSKNEMLNIVAGYLYTTSRLSP